MKNFTDCTQAQQIERWENVLRVLRALTPHQRRKHWDMSKYVVETDCGTIACAVGHCSLDPWFRRRGLRIKPSPRGEYACFSQTVDGRDTPKVVKEMFGVVGARLFFNQERRPVSQVLREVRAHIKALRVAA